MQRILLSSCFAVVSLGFVGCSHEGPVTPAKPDVPALSPNDKPVAEATKPTPEAPKPAPEAAKPAPEPTKPVVEAPKPATVTPKAVDGPTDAAITQMLGFIATQQIDQTAKNWRTKLAKPPQLTFDPKHRYYWSLQTTEGPIEVQFLTDVAPMHVSSTIYLTELGFYDGLAFHRVIPKFMAQGGDPLGNGTGGPGYKYGSEFSPDAKHSKAGILSMAHAGQGTDGSQFFLTFGPTPSLDGVHTVFGEVVEGLDNLKKLETFGSKSGATHKPLKIESAKIVVE